MRDVAVLGPASWNQIVQVSELPAPRAQTVFAQAVHETLGGTSAGKALHLVDLGHPVELHTVVGSDEYGDKILSALEGARVPTVAQRVGRASERHCNLMTPAGERLSIYLSTPTEDPEPPVLRQNTTLVLDLASWTRELARTIRRGQRPIWTDLHDWNGYDEFHQPFAAAATHVFLSADGPDDPVGLLHRLVDEGVSVAVCTMGARGAVAVDTEHREWTVAAEPVNDVVDTNGAGDGFFAGVLHASLLGAELPEALSAGVRQAVRALESPHLSPLVRT